MTLLHHELVGPPDGPVLVLSNSLGTTLGMWDPQIPAFTQHFRVLRYDHRGHGASGVGAGGFGMGDLAGDVCELLDHHGIERASFAGLSLGGMTGMALAAAHAERVDRLVLCCTSPWFETGLWVARAAQVREHGVGSLVEMLLGRWFTPAFRQEKPEIVEGFAAMLRGSDGEGYAQCCDAIGLMDLREDVRRIEAPTLLVFGAEDPVTTPAIGEALRESIPGAGLVVVPGASHLANVEQPSAVTAAILRHLLGDPLERGLAVRRAVQGDARVDDVLAAASDFTMPFQEILTRFAFGDVWSRPGLSIETRRVVAVSVLVALGRMDELETHIRAALEHGVPAETIREVLLQTAVYAGVPAANAAFSVAARVLAEREVAGG